jgi:glycosylphosphatidylinositol transamidase (GPIT) subunit GPI8
LFQNENIDVYGDDVEVDYRGYEVTVENFVRLLTGRLPEDTPRYGVVEVLVFFRLEGAPDVVKHCYVG